MWGLCEERHPGGQSESEHQVFGKGVAQIVKQTYSETDRKIVKQTYRNANVEIETTYNGISSGKTSFQFSTLSVKRVFSTSNVTYP